MAEKRRASFWAYVRWALMGLLATVVLGMGAFSVPPTSAALPDQLPPLRQVIPSPPPLEPCPPLDQPGLASIAFQTEITNRDAIIPYDNVYETTVNIKSPRNVVVDARIYFRLIHHPTFTSVGCQRADVRTLWYGRTDTSTYSYRVPWQARSGDYYFRITILSTDLRLMYYESPYSFPPPGSIAKSPYLAFNVPTR